MAKGGYVNKLKDARFLDRKLKVCPVIWMPYPYTLGFSKFTDYLSMLETTFKTDGYVQSQRQTP